jgi:Zn-dependent M32 family carboxypeptidase
LTQIPKETLLYDEIEKIWHDIDKNDDWSLFNNKIDSISKLKEANIINGLG